MCAAPEATECNAIPNPSVVNIKVVASWSRNDISFLAAENNHTYTPVQSSRKSVPHPCKTVTVTLQKCLEVTMKDVKVAYQQI